MEFLEVSLPACPSITSVMHCNGCVKGTGTTGSSHDCDGDIRDRDGRQFTRMFCCSLSCGHLNWNQRPPSSVCSACLMKKPAKCAASITPSFTTIEGLGDWRVADQETCKYAHELCFLRPLSGSSPCAWPNTEAWVLGQLFSHAAKLVNKLLKKMKITFLMLIVYWTSKSL